ncbi:MULTISPECIES: hypothetical protein [unclassified Methanosarcina]|uniref:hypothetical protein n=1 Tax=unclassified Methanosarcina TaxID=2644672 RepID=UPI0012E09FBD|nr:MULTISPECIES: hypothetical protein [unclassified Methanosarcina]
MNVTDTQINEIYNVINAIGNKKNIQDIPVIFKKSDFVKDAVASGYDTKYRNPLIGAIQLTGQTGARGTLGFCAKTGSGTGYVTAQHLGTHVGYQMYQPTKTSQNSLGTVSMISGHHADACFVPYGDVSAKIHIGNGNTLPVVTYMSAQPSDEWSGLTVYKSGKVL